jgi:hypothetical protein
MSVLGIDEITYGADDLANSRKFFLDWGLNLLAAEWQPREFEPFPPSSPNGRSTVASTAIPAARNRPKRRLASFSPTASKQE